MRMLHVRLPVASSPGAPISVGQSRRSQDRQGFAMKPLAKTLTIQSAPHLGSALGVDAIMFNVVFALLPVCVYAVYLFGLPALLVFITGLVSCVATEHVLCRLSRQETTIADGSVVITGILYALVLPPSLP